MSRKDKEQKTVLPAPSRTTEEAAVGVLDTDPPRDSDKAADGPSKAIHHLMIAQVPHSMKYTVERIISEIASGTVPAAQQGQVLHLLAGALEHDTSEGMRRAARELRAAAEALG